MNAIVCNYKIKGCFWSKIKFSFMRLLHFLGRVMFLRVVNSRGEASKPGCFRGVIFKRRLFSAAKFINVRSFVGRDWWHTNVSEITRELCRKLICAHRSALISTLD